MTKVAPKLVFSAIKILLRAIKHSTKGKEVFSKTIAGTKGQFELLVDPGVYYVKLKTENGRESNVKKILIIE